MAKKLKILTPIVLEAPIDPYKKIFSCNLTEPSWVRVAKVIDPTTAGQATFTLTIHGIIAATEEKNLFTTSVFRVLAGLNSVGDFNYSILPLLQAPVINQESNSTYGSGGSYLLGRATNPLTSADAGCWGASSICLERHEDEIYVCVLIQYPPIEKYSSLEITAAMENAVNIVFLDELEPVDLLETEGIDLPLLEGMEFSTKDNTVNYMFQVSGSIDDFTNYFYNITEENKIDFENPPITPKTMDIIVTPEEGEDFILLQYLEPEYNEEGFDEKSPEKCYKNLLTAGNESLSWTSEATNFPYDLFKRRQYSDVEKKIEIDPSKLVFKLSNDPNYDKYFNIKEELEKALFTDTITSIDLYQIIANAKISYTTNPEDEDISLEVSLVDTLEELEGIATSVTLNSPEESTEIEINSLYFKDLYCPQLKFVGGREITIEISIDTAESKIRYNIPFAALDDYNTFKVKEVNTNIDFASITVATDKIHAKSRSHTLDSLGDNSYRAYEAVNRAESAYYKAEEALDKINRLLEYLQNNYGLEIDLAAIEKEETSDENSSC